ncbi:hypothetical protein BLOT_016801 [Blomia tropicalis]|nr:hypothetical protein BLOT_016801 [Blomia tropicalis]
MSKKTITYVMAKTTNDDYQIIDSSEVYEYSRQWNDNPSMWPSEATWETDSGEKKIEIIYVGNKESCILKMKTFSNRDVKDTEINQCRCTEELNNLKKKSLPAHITYVGRENIPIETHKVVLALSHNVTKKGFLYLFESIYGKDWKEGKTWIQLDNLVKDRIETILMHFIMVGLSRKGGKPSLADPEECAKKFDNIHEKIVKMLNNNKSNTKRRTKSTESVQKISRTMSSFSSPELYEKFYNEAMVDLENLQSTSSTTGITTTIRVQDSPSSNNKTSMELFNEIMNYSDNDDD